MAPSSLPTVDLMHPTQIAKLFHRAGWIEWLEDVTHGQDLVLPARRLADDGLAAWAKARERGYEGLVGKEEDSKYIGGTTLRWLKLKRPDARDVVAARRRWR